MRLFIALQNVVHLKRQLAGETDPKQRAIIERLIFQEEAEVAAGGSQRKVSSPQGAA